MVNQTIQQRSSRVEGPGTLVWTLTHTLWRCAQALVVGHSQSESINIKKETDLEQIVGGAP